MRCTFRKPEMPKYIHKFACIHRDLVTRARSFHVHTSFVRSDLAGSGRGGGGGGGYVSRSQGHQCLHL